MLLLQKHVGGLVRATFSKSITNQAGPLLNLHYGLWTRLSPDLALPENAQVDWLNGVARAPAAWDLQLDPDAIVLFDAARDECHAKKPIRGPALPHYSRITPADVCL
jgi:hypothetical protein